MPMARGKTMNKCPADADEDHYDNPCLARTVAMCTCTRPEGHAGDHHAHDYKGNCLKKWNDKDIKVRPTAGKAEPPSSLLAGGSE